MPSSFQLKKASNIVSNTLNNNINNSINSDINVNVDGSGKDSSAIRRHIQTPTQPPNQPLPFDAPSWVLKLTIGLIGMFAFLQVYSIQAILPVLMVDMSATEVQAGMIVGATILAIAIMSPFLGMLSDAVGRKSFIVGALFFLAIPTALIAQSPNIGW